MLEPEYALPKEEAYQRVLEKKSIFKSALQSLYELYLLYLRIESSDQSSALLQEAKDSLRKATVTLVQDLQQVYLQLTTFFLDCTPAKYQSAVALFQLIDSLWVSGRPVLPKHLSEEVALNQIAVQNLQRSKDVLLGVQIKFLEELGPQCKEQSLIVSRDVLVFCLLQLQQIFMLERNDLVRALQNYDIYKFKPGQGRLSCPYSETEERENQRLRSNRSVPVQFPVEAIKFGKRRGLFRREQSHSKYLQICSASKFRVAPLKLFRLQLRNSTEFFSQNSFSKGVRPFLHYFEPLTKKLHYFDLQEEEFMELQRREVHFPIPFVFSPEAKSVATPRGQLFILAARNSRSLDDSLYEVALGQGRLRARAAMPLPRKMFGLGYFRRCLVVVGGVTSQQRCAKSCLCYNIYKKEWQGMADLSAGISNPVLSAVNSRYLLRFGGLNEFDYIDKSIECYDHNFNAWTVVKTRLASPVSEIQFAHKSTVVQFAPQKYFVFGGKNSENLQTLEGYAFTIENIVEKQRKPSRIEGDVEQVKALDNWLFNSLGSLAPGLGVCSQGSIYLLRVGYS